MYVAYPNKFDPNQTRGLTVEKIFCLIIWVTGISIGVFRTYARIKIEQENDDEAVAALEKICFVLITATVLLHLVGMIVSSVSVLCMVKLLCKYSPVRSDVGPDSSSDGSDGQDLLIIDRDNMILIYHSVKSGLQVLLALYLTDLVFSVYLNILSVFTMKIYLTRGCYPEVFVQIRNYLGTTTNFIYSYHCIDVIHGMCICIIFFLQNSMKQTVKFMWRFASLVMTCLLRRRSSRARYVSF